MNQVKQRAGDSFVLFVEALCASNRINPDPSLSLGHTDRLSYLPDPSVVSVVSVVNDPSMPYYQLIGGSK